MRSSTPQGFLIVVSGLRAEARIASGPAVRPIAGGGFGLRLAIEIDRAIAVGGRAVLSFGMAGGLEPGLAAGTIVIPSVVVSGEERLETNTLWTASLRAALPGSVDRTLAGVDAPVASDLARKAMRIATGAAAVDMESHIAARVAGRAGLPCAVLRVIADPAERTLPEAAIAGMGTDGRLDIGAVLRALVRNPRQLRALVRLAGDARRAMAVLGRCRHVLGPDFGFGATHFS